MPVTSSAKPSRKIISSCNCQRLNVVLSCQSDDAFIILFQNHIRARYRNSKLHVCLTLSQRKNNNILNTIYVTFYVAPHKLIGESKRFFFDHNYILDY